MNTTQYVAGRYLLETYQTETPTGKIIVQSKVLCTYLTAQEAKQIFKKDKYGTPFFSKLGFRSVFLEEMETEQRAGIPMRNMRDFDKVMSS